MAKKPFPMRREIAPQVPLWHNGERTLKRKAALRKEKTAPRLSFHGWHRPVAALSLVAEELLEGLIEDWY